MVESLYKAIAAECRSSVPELKKIYRDNIPQNMEFPCILVEITETTAKRRLSERQRIKQNFDVQYFPGNESENRRKECEKVKQKMLRRFDVVSADGISFYVRNKNDLHRIREERDPEDGRNEHKYRNGGKRWQEYGKARIRSFRQRTSTLLPIHR